MCPQSALDAASTPVPLLSLIEKVPPPPPPPPPSPTGSGIRGAPMPPPCRLHAASRLAESAGRFVTVTPCAQLAVALRNWCAEPAAGDRGVDVEEERVAAAATGLARLPATRAELEERSGGGYGASAGERAKVRDLTAAQQAAGLQRGP